MFSAKIQNIVSCAKIMVRVSVVCKKKAVAVAIAFHV